MKIAFGELKPLLQAQRIFVGGQTLACGHAFYRDDLSIEIPENLATEAYTTYWGAAANGWPHWAPLAIREPCCRR
jgi:hypothetical protein